MGIEKLSETQIAIIAEISRAFDRLGAERGIFVALHSWGDTMSDLEVLQMLKEQNDIMQAWLAIDELLELRAWREKAFNVHPNIDADINALDENVGV